MARNSGSVSQTVSAVAVIDLANELASLGCINEQFLGQMGAEFKTLYLDWKANRAIQEERLPEPLLIRLWEAVEDSTIHPNLGLEIGQKVNHHSRGVLANWLFQCETLSEVFATFSKNIHLLNPSERWERTDDGDKVKLKLEFKSLDYPSSAIDRSMAAAVSWSAALTGMDITPISATFTRSRPRSINRYKEIFGKHILFGQSENSLVFPKSVFSQPIEKANPYLKSLLEKQASEISESLNRKPSVSEKVKTLLAKELQAFSQIEAVCQVLHLSRSTLFRKLKSEGTSYTELLKDARLIKMKEMENRSINHDAIADALGFLDSGSYYRFRKAIE